MEVLVARIWPKARSWGICVLYPWCYAWTSPWFFDNIAGARLSILTQVAQICSWCLGMVLKCLYSCQELRQDVSRCFKCTFLDFQKSFPTSNSKVLDDHRLLRQQSLLPYSEYHCLCQWYWRSPGPQLDPRQLLDSVYANRWKAKRDANKKLK